MENLKIAATNNETRKHIANVSKYMGILITHLLKRAVEHDATKLESPEVELFTVYTEKLSGCTYGSDEYKEFLKGLKPALDHHYGHYSHHPEHFVDGIDGMNLVDLVEMMVDWKAATLRTKDGSLSNSIDINAKRFNISPQLVKILQNTVKLFEENS